VGADVAGTASNQNIHRYDLLMMGIAPFFDTSIVAKVPGNCNCGDKPFCTFFLLLSPTGDIITVLNFEFQFSAVLNFGKFLGSL